jgi:hypothetical protein
MMHWRSQSWTAASGISWSSAASSERRFAALALSSMALTKRELLRFLLKWLVNR